MPQFQTHHARREANQISNARNEITHNQRPAAKALEPALGLFEPGGSKSDSGKVGTGPSAERITQTDADDAPQHRSQKGRNKTQRVG